MVIGVIYLGTLTLQSLSKVQLTIVIQYTSCRIQSKSPHGPLAVHSVCALFIHSPGSVNCKLSGLERATYDTIQPVSNLFPLLLLATLS